MQQLNMHYLNALSSLTREHERLKRKNQITVAFMFMFWTVFAILFTAEAFIVTGFTAYVGSLTGGDHITVFNTGVMGVVGLAYVSILFKVMSITYCRTGEDSGTMANTVLGIMVFLSIVAKTSEVDYDVIRFSISMSIFLALSVFTGIINFKQVHKINKLRALIHDQLALVSDKEREFISETLTLAFYRDKFSPIKLNASLPFSNSLHRLKRETLINFINDKQPPDESVHIVDAFARHYTSRNISKEPIIDIAKKEFSKHSATHPCQVN